MAMGGMGYFWIWWQNLFHSTTCKNVIQPIFIHAVASTFPSILIR